MFTFHFLKKKKNHFRPFIGIALDLNSCMNQRVSFFLLEGKIIIVILPKGEEVATRTKVTNYSAKKKNKKKTKVTNLSRIQLRFK